MLAGHPQIMKMNSESCYLREAFEDSINVVGVQIIKRVGGMDKR